MKNGSLHHVDAAKSSMMMAAAATVEDHDSFEPHQPTHIKHNPSTADGKLWEEKLVVCEASASKLVIHSYFKNCHTRQCKWDEPPMGASHIEHASVAERQEKEEELWNLQLAMTVNNDNNNNNQCDTDHNSKKAGKGFFSGLMKKSNKTNGGVAKGGGRGGGQFTLNKKKSQRI